MTSNKKCAQIGVIESFVSGCKPIPLDFQIEFIPRCALREMFPLQMKCSVYANLIKKDLGMMDWGMEK